jgi:polyisoprenoid-binding protein YceI
MLFHWSVAAPVLFEFASVLLSSRFNPGDAGYFRRAYRKHRSAGMALLGLSVASLASAAPTTYNIDPNHTHPMFEADHLNGTSIWRGLFKKTSGTITLDSAARTGTVDVAVDMASADFANDELTNIAVNSSAPPIFEAKKYPTAFYKGTLGGFVNGSPTTASGRLTLHGVTKPITLVINSFKCIDDKPLPKQQVCGADVFCVLNRADFGITVGQKYGFKMEVTLRIQVEAIRAE